jgi:hypothetical protein
VLREVERDSPEIAHSVENGDHDRCLAAGERRDAEGKPRMIVVMRHADDRHRFANAKLLAKRIGGPSRLDTAAQVECRNLVEVQQAKRSRKFIKQDSDQRGAEGRVVPGAEPGSNPVWLDA